MHLHSPLIAEEIANGVTEGVAGDANVIFGARMLPELGEEIRVMSIVTGVKAKFGERKLNANATPMRLEALQSIY